MGGGISEPLNVWITNCRGTLLSAGGLLSPFGGVRVRSPLRGGGSGALFCALDLDMGKSSTCTAAAYSPLLAPEPL